MFQEMIRQIQRAETISYTGKMKISSACPSRHPADGPLWVISVRSTTGTRGGQVMAEVVGFKNDHILLMPYSDMSGISAGNFVRNTGRRLSLRMGPLPEGAGD